MRKFHVVVLWVLLLPTDPGDYGVPVEHWSWALSPPVLGQSEWKNFEDCERARLGERYKYAVMAIRSAGRRKSLWAELFRESHYSEWERAMWWREKFSRGQCVSKKWFALRQAKRALEKAKLELKEAEALP